MTDLIDENGLRALIGTLGDSELEEKAEHTLEQALKSVEQIHSMEKLATLTNQIECGTDGTVAFGKVGSYYTRVCITAPELSGPIDEIIRTENFCDVEMDFNTDLQRYEIEGHFKYSP